MSALGIAVVGCGAIAASKYLDNLSLMPEVCLLGFLGGQADQYRTRYGASGAAVYRSLDELCADSRIDAVCVCTPNNTHAAIATACLNAGKHVICEKPMAIDEVDAQAMIIAAERNSLTLTIGHQARFSPAAQALRRRIAQGEFGELYYVRSRMLRRRGVPTWGHFLDPVVQGGGCLMDLGTHALDLALWLLDDFEPLSAMCATYRALADQPTAANRWGAWDAKSFGVEDAAFATIHLRGGATLELACSFALNVPTDRENDVTLCGTRTGAELRDGMLHVNGVRDDAFYLDTYPAADDENEANRRQLADFVEAIRTGRDPLVTAQQSLAVCRILCGLYHSAVRRQPVQFD